MFASLECGSAVSLKFFLYDYPAAKALAEDKAYYEFTSSSAIKTSASSSFLFLIKLKFIMCSRASSFPFL
jgi:hypothetical protein